MIFGCDGAVVRITLVDMVILGWDILCKAVYFWNKALSRVAVWTKSLTPRAHQVNHNAHGSSTLSSKEKETTHLSHSCMPCSTKCVAGW